MAPFAASGSPGAQAWPLGSREAAAAWQPAGNHRRRGWEAMLRPRCASASPLSLCPCAVRSRESGSGGRQGEDRLGRRESHSRGPCCMVEAINPLWRWFPLSMICILRNDPKAAPHVHIGHTKIISDEPWHLGTGHFAISEETRIKISMGVRRGWNLRLQKLMIQDGCFVEWRDMIADAARKGFAGGISLQWNSYKILTEQMRQEWLEKVQKRRSMPRPTGNRRAPKSPEQRRKIAEAIAAKWLDKEYRERVCSGIASYHGTSSGTKVPRKPRSAREPGSKRDTVKKKPIQSRSAGLEDACGTTPTVKRKKSATPYKDPMAGEKLEMITKIRAQRAALEIEKKEAIKRARSLIAEAEKAANALETVASTSPFAQASLIEARKLVTEARLSLQHVDDEGPADSASDDASQDSGASDLHNHDMANQNDVIKQENKPVNGMELPPSNVNGRDFYFDVSTLTETDHLRDYQRIENSMERAYLLPSASSAIQDVNENHRMKDFNAHQLMVNDESITIDQIASEVAEIYPDEPQEDDTLPVQKSKMRWVRGRLVEVEE
uniref:NUMOD3 motif family protein, expressed n=1 Tax=Oryza sativa subsp. japonica TaxID=39947 RepID=Q8H8F6_ORYSJ|nr:hypothetical protein [Oryza sativa Japonica Group]